MSTARMKPLVAPFDEPIQAAFDTIMPEGMEPLNLFKTKAKHPELFSYQMALGGILLYKGVLDRVERELIAGFRHQVQHSCVSRVFDS